MTYQRVTYRVNPSMDDGCCIAEAGRVLECFYCFLPIRSGEQCFRAASDRPYHLECAVSGQALLKRGYPAARSQQAIARPEKEDGQSASLAGDTASAGRAIVRTSGDGPRPSTA